MKLARLLLPLSLLALAACQQPKPAADKTSPDAKPGLSVSDGKLLLPAVKGNPGAAYFTITNTTERVVTLAAVSIDGTDKAEMHETRAGVMEPVKLLEVNPGITARFERGGLHVMVFGLKDTVKSGGSAEMTLTFEGGDKLSAPLKVEMTGAGHGDMR